MCSAVAPPSSLCCVLFVQYMVRKRQCWRVKVVISAHVGWGFEWKDNVSHVLCLAVSCQLGLSLGAGTCLHYFIYLLFYFFISLFLFYLFISLFISLFIYLFICLLQQLTRMMEYYYSCLSPVGPPIREEFVYSTVTREVLTDRRWFPCPGSCKASAPPQFITTVPASVQKCTDSQDPPSSPPLFVLSPLLNFMKILLLPERGPTSEYWIN
jgi:hypothetical protein